MRPRLFEFDLNDVDADAVAQAQTPLAAGNLTLNGAAAVTTMEGMPRVLTTKAVFELPRKISIACAGNDSGRTFTLTGIDGFNRLVSENIAGANASSNDSTQYYKEVHQVAVDDATAGGITVGTVDEVAYVFPLDFYSDSQAHFEINVTGTISYSVQETFNNVQGPYTDHLNTTRFQWTTISGFPPATVDASNVASVNAQGAQLLVASYSNGAEISVALVQPGRQC